MLEHEDSEASDFCIDIRPKQWAGQRDVAPLPTYSEDAEPGKVLLVTIGSSAVATEPVEIVSTAVVLLCASNMRRWSCVIQENLRKDFRR